MVTNQRNNRKKINTDFFKFNILITTDLKKAPTYFEASDISDSAISFKVDSKISLNSIINIIILDISKDELININGFVSRLDEINEINNPTKKFKVVVKFNENNKILFERF